MIRYDFPKFHIFDNDLEDHPTYHFYIYDDRSKLPVFHITSDYVYGDYTIGLFEPVYYKYNSRHAYILDYPEILDYTLRLKNEKNKSKSNWEVLKDTWLSMYGNRKDMERYINSIDINTQPDYSKMTEKDIKRRSICRAIVSKWKA